ncbi:MAG: CaiB/BaiF CoA transferase family protein [Pseudomonadales bacterium]
MEREQFYANARRDIAGPLDGVTVVEATTTWAGPMAGCILGDYGATVIKVEHPDGEVCRRMPPMIPDTNLTVAHETVNRNKLNVSMDLRREDGRDAFLKICETADIVIENFRPGTLAKWGIGYDDVAKVKPDIIYLSVSGFGQYGTLSHRVGYDPLAQNYCGWTSLNGEPGSGSTKAPTFLADDLGGMHGAMAVMAALRHRDQTGEGQHVDVALVDSLLYQSNGNPTSGALGVPLEKMGNQFSLAAPINVYDTLDERVYAGVLLDSHWAALCELMGTEHLAQLTLLERIEQRDVVDGALAAYCASQASATLVATFSDLGLPAVAVNTYAQLSQEEHIHSRDMLPSVELADGTIVPLTAPPAKFSRTPVGIRSRAATLGEHNQEVLGALGYSAADIAALQKQE